MLDNGGQTTTACPLNHNSHPCGRPRAPGSPEISKRQYAVPPDILTGAPHRPESPPLPGGGKGARKLPPEIGLRSCDCRNLSVLACNDRGAYGTLVH